MELTRHRTDVKDDACRPNRRSSSPTTIAAPADFVAAPSRPPRLPASGWSGSGSGCSASAASQASRSGSRRQAGADRSRAQPARAAVPLLGLRSLGPVSKQPPQAVAACARAAIVRRAQARRRARSLPGQHAAGPDSVPVSFHAPPAAAARQPGRAERGWARKGHRGSAGAGEENATAATAAELPRPAQRPDSDHDHASAPASAGTGQEDPPPPPPPEG